MHYGPEFLCSLLNEQPMGFYAPDSLVHEAEGRGIPVLGFDVNASEVQCTVEGPRGRMRRSPWVGSRMLLLKTTIATRTSGDLGVRLGLGYIKGAAVAEVAELVAERERGGPFVSLGELAARVGARRGTLEQLAWSGACDSLVLDGVIESKDGALDLETAGSPDARRRLALWMIGVPTRPIPTRPAGQGSAGDGGAGTQLTLPLELPQAPRLRPLSRWQRLLADYATSGVTVGDHVMAALRLRLRVPMLATSAQLARLPQGCTVAVAGLVIARQRPGTAKGTMFLLFEDEWGTVNLIVPRAVYEAYRALARAEPLLLAHGRLERTAVQSMPAAWRRGGSGGTLGADGQDGERGQERIPPVVNVIVRELVALERFLAVEEQAPTARVHHLREEDGTEMGAAMRAVAPPVQSFASGRRR